MIEVLYDIVHPQTGAKGRLRVAGGIWIGDECVFEFTDTVYGLVGVARCDWRQPAPRLEVQEGPAADAGARQLMAKLQQLLLAFHHGAYRGASDEVLAALYQGSYHREMNYAVNSPLEAEYKGRLSALLLELCDAGKVLDVGCAAGEVVRQLRQRGVEAWGFDICPQLDEIAYEDTRAFLRRGSADAIPFGPEDGFDTAIALDVLEHVPEDRVPAMVQELVRLGIKNVAAHIALCEFQYPGHVTLRPMHWWDAQLAPWYRRDAFSDGGVAARMVPQERADPAQMLRVYRLIEAPALRPELVLQR
jgi:SAM-dependent methyltransferase